MTMNRGSWRRQFSLWRSVLKTYLQRAIPFLPWWRVTFRRGFDEGDFVLTLLMCAGSAGMRLFVWRPEGGDLHFCPFSCCLNEVLWLKRAMVPRLAIVSNLLKVHTWTVCFLKILLASVIPVLRLIYEMVLRFNNEPENLENIVWKQNSILATNTGYTGEVTHQWIIIYDNDKNQIKNHIFTFSVQSLRWPFLSLRWTFRFATQFITSWTANFDWQLETIICTRSLHRRVYFIGQRWHNGCSFLVDKLSR